ncbi:DUF4350 domain-containing protein [Pseudomonas sp. UBA2684]|uniref:DUF4350 domain-containing protein n=1 Tax=Pseudomonas sp. UBA2684 TaxID=1947311 RepID=UPI000E94CEC5|nr:DUF4350 domain-containing protein [Pseudomonas sp. UBA2684]HBX54205.1 DUF4350 domain-containing protein [Pseudomonas sp.]|tara:strand:- start:4767 stop:5972 length:1206 start_codon:yes stop_codon:yes gene_type:complete
MSRRILFIGAGALLLGLGLLGAYLLSRAVPYQETVEHGPAPEVRANPYLAAEHFLRQQGLPVQRADGLEVLPTLPSAGQTLLLLGDRQRMSPRQTEHLLAWAAKGGHLLFVAERLWDEDQGQSGDLLLDSLGIQQYQSDDLDEAAADTDIETPPAEAAEPDEATTAYPELTQLYLENEEAPAYFGFDTDFHLYDANNRAHAWANSGAATHLLQLYHGDGLISVLSDSWIWQNERIAEHDNAWLLWYLSQDSAVTLLYRAERDDLFSLLLRHFPEALAALALLIGLLLWSVGMRQGPLQMPASLSRRQLQEHLRGSADFLLRRSGQQPLLQGLQQDIQRRARHRHPGFERLGVAEQWQVLGRLTRLPSSAISQAMRPLPKQRLAAADFTRQVAHLQTLRNAL